jgi:hypothetical protein
MTRSPSSEQPARRIPCIWAFALLALLGLFSAGRLSAAPAYCATCGSLLLGQFFTAEDKVTFEKKQLCSNCVKLTTVCFACGLPISTNLTDLPDGRLLCARDARAAVLKDEDGLQVCSETRDALDRLFSRWMEFPETNATVTLVDRVHLQELFKYPGNDYQCPNVWGYMDTHTNRNHVTHSIRVLSALSAAGLKATCAHEYTHAWLNQNLSTARKQNLSHDSNEGFCELIAYLLMDSQHEEGQKAVILANAYTRGQINVLIQANKEFGFNDVLDWMKFGVDDHLQPENLGRIRTIEIPKAQAPAPLASSQIKRSAGTTNSSAIAAAPAAPAPLVLKGIFFSQKNPTAVINDHTFEVNQEAKIRMGKTNVTIRCLAIMEDAVRIQIKDSGETRELRLQ